MLRTALIFINVLYLTTAPSVQVTMESILGIAIQMAVVIQMAVWMSVIMSFAMGVGNVHDGHGDVLDASFKEV